MDQVTFAGTVITNTGMLSYHVAEGMSVSCSTDVTRDCGLQVNLDSTSDAVESIANVTDVHEAMYFHVDDELAARANFGIWSLRWSPDGREVIAGTGDSSLYVYDVEQQKVCSV